MSYTIAIVAAPIPDNDAEAWTALDGLIDQDGAAPQAFRELHDELTARYPCLCSLTDDQIDDGVWSDGPLWNNFRHAAAVLGIIYPRVNEVLPFLIETATSRGLSVFDWATALVHRADGYEALALSVENKPLLRAPTTNQLFAAVDALSPDGGPGYLVLDGLGGDYAQAAGGNNVYTAEWREYSGDQFRHFVAGLLGQSSSTNIAIPTNGFQITVRENERLNALDVKSILGAFAERNGRPPSYAWRDVTDRFA
jgi:hypothetical protein